MATKGKPTIEQTSQFSAKTKEGRDIELVAELRFYISPTEEVKISAPGSTASKESLSSKSSSELKDSMAVESQKYSQTNVQASISPKEESADEGKRRVGGYAGEPAQQGGETGQRGGETGQQGGGTAQRGGGGFKSDASIDRAFPRNPLNDCSTEEFIPDPCKAVDELQYSIRSLWQGIFGCSSTEPPPTATNAEHYFSPEGIFAQTDGEEGSLKKERIDEDEKENENDVLRNEQKHEV